MKHSLAVLLALLLVMACSPSVPSDYIQPGDMEDILYDYHVAKAMASQDGYQTKDFNRKKYFLAVLKKHDVTEADFDSSLVYYYSHIDRLKDIYAEVNSRLADEAKLLGASVGDINRFSQYSTIGDTANIWAERTDLMLMPQPTMNRFDFTIEADTSFYKGDSFMFQFMADYLWQTGAKDAVVCIVSKYEGDSIIQTANHVTVSGIAQIRVPANTENKLKEMQGFIYLPDGMDDTETRRMMFISQMQFIRFHNKQLQQDHDTIKAEPAPTDSILQGDDPRGPMPDSLRRRVFQRGPGHQPISPAGGTPVHSVAPGPVDPKK